jgi:hypothetical protein
MALLKSDGISGKNRGMNLPEFYQQISRRLRDQFDKKVWSLGAMLKFGFASD